MPFRKEGVCLCMHISVAMISFELRCFMFFVFFDAAKLRQYFPFTKKVNKKMIFFSKKR